MIGSVLLATGLALNNARAIALTAHARPAWVLLDLPQAIDPGPNDNYADLRIVDDRGDEVPYVLDPQCDVVPRRDGILSDAGFVPGRYTEALVDAGNSGAPYSGISIETPRETYFSRVDVAISDDRQTWRELRNGALIYRVADAGDPGTQTVTLSLARARWIRLRIFDRSSAFPIDSVTIDGSAVGTIEAVKRLDATAQTSWNDEERTSVVTLDLGTPNTRISSLRFWTTQREFSRSANIYTSNNGEDWEFAGDGDIERFAHGAPVLAVAAPASARFVRAEVLNGNDVPLPNLRVSAYGPRRVLVFVARPSRTYALMRVLRDDAPVYDLETLLTHDNSRVFETAYLRVNAPAQLFERRVRAAQPLVLTLTLAIAIVVLGGVTLVTLRPLGGSSRA